MSHPQSECFQHIIFLSSGGHCPLIIIRGCGLSSSQIFVSSFGGISVFLRIIYGSLLVRFDSLIGGLAVLEENIPLFGFAFYFNRCFSCFSSMWWSSLSVMARKATKIVSFWISDFTSLHWVPLVVASGGCGGLVADPGSCCLRWFNDCAGGPDLRGILVFPVKSPSILVYQ
ncbi:hypothetical protein Bca4012_049700 [Brassica carinata]